MQDSYIGSTSASQAEKAGSIPVSCSNGLMFMPFLPPKVIAGLGCSPDRLLLLLGFHFCVLVGFMVILDYL